MLGRLGRAMTGALKGGALGTLIGEAIEIGVGEVKAISDPVDTSFVVVIRKGSGGVIGGAIGVLVGATLCFCWE